MANDNELLIRISADAKKFNEALEQAKSETESLDTNLKKAATVTGIAFAALTAEIGFATKAYAESKIVAGELTQSLIAQGIYTKKLQQSYTDIANSIQDKTGVDNDQIIAGQAVLQNYIKQTEITPELTQAIVDFATKQKVDLVTAFEAVGKGVKGQTGLLQRNGVIIGENIDKSQALSIIQQTLKTQFDGAAEAANKNGLGVKGLVSQIGDLQKLLGEKFAPVVEATVAGLTRFFAFINEHKKLVSFAADVLVFGAAVTGMATAVLAGASAFLALKALIVASGVAVASLTAVVAPLGIAIAVVAAIFTAFALHWNTVVPAMKAAWEGFSTFVVESAKGIGQILKGLFTRNFEDIKAGISNTVGAYQKSYQATTDSYKAMISEQKALADAAEKEKEKKSKDQAEAQKKLEQDKLNAMAASQKATNELRVLEAQKASKDLIDLQKQEIDILKQMEDEKNGAILVQLRTRLNEVNRLQSEQREIDKEKRRIFNDEILLQNEEFQALTEDQQKDFKKRNEQGLLERELTDKQVRDQYIRERLAADIQEKNTYLLNQQKFGKTYAEVQKTLNSEQLKGAQTLSGALIGLQSSTNSTLKTIGKAAAVADIAIKTAQGALAAYAGSIAFFGPLYGPIIGTALAGAVVAFGAEQTSNVLGAAKGGLMTGGIAGRDSIPTFTQPGELVAPTKNFDEVVNAVADQRLAQRGSLGSGEGGGGGFAHLVLGVKQGFMDLFEIQQVERQNLNISVVGS